ncbi:UbiX family flavin prenyltransferase [Hyphomicrobium sp. LHD-15]|uniref:UbiX family flavin prenyltransferase n=1 Tax=Hyphomicrobium sp. LHD-15 TaxID=3072142 RepID=UPI00280E62DD|nr:UbiX family flavin prenyltransferase [Hyphomicrobium sp. LHD-15]MDQ8698255.1 UbiX family flavin prenyltransferase [Hyphomicrobium sp. LHD-15]
MDAKRVVLGVSGASGAAIAVRIGAILAELRGLEVHLVVSQAAERTLAHEVGPDALRSLEQVCAYRHSIVDIGASIASGSFRTAGMIIAPCSMRTTSAIASGVADNLLTRAADVHLKERRRLVLVVRESPLHLGHLRAMQAVTEYGAIVAPPVASFYLAPATISDIVEQIARRTIDLLSLDGPALAVPWRG